MLRILALLLLALVPNPDSPAERLRRTSAESVRLLRLTRGWALSQVIYDGMPEEQWRPLVKDLRRGVPFCSSSTTLYTFPAYRLVLACSNRSGRARGATFFFPSK